ncbi:cytochrome b/b6 domain-containing protein [Ideonella sp. 4Y11]|uniref:Cytochrome b/b6 domain-containing protein n=1 Tax=Ideonella aquatica TaxID=2824119 RepID=A0A940YJB8_9BURK|nr:cytochrome b/b6 domain-containing protein [Ideonella aquatica]MBQ0960564.1 cytochrome b/b6 domain-containing protein [Ideonella aquatica]
MNSPTPVRTTVRVWDLPTRLFHWSLVLCVIGLVVTGQIGGNLIEWHLRLGMVVGALLIFRVLWGLVGGRWSRFASFVKMPGTILRYLKGEARPDEHLDVGHNPLGALSVLALLGLLALQVATGLVADDEIATTGPLNRFVSSAQASLATGWHTELGKLLLIVLVVLHISAIVFYLKKKGQNLVRPMLHGDKDLPADTPPSADGWGQRLLALALFAACVALMGWVFSLGEVAASF